MVGEFLVRKSDRPGQAHRHAMRPGSGRAGRSCPGWRRSPGRRAADRCKSRTGWMLTKRRSSDRLRRAAGNQPPPGKGGMLPSLDAVRARRRWRRGRARCLRASFFRAARLPSDWEIAPGPAQRRIGGERAEKGLGLDQIGRRPAHLVDAQEQDAVPGEEFAAVGASDRAGDARLGREIGRQRRGRFVGGFGRRRVDHGDDLVGALREGLIEPDLLAPPWRRFIDRSLSLSVVMAK